MKTSPSVCLSVAGFRALVCFEVISSADSHSSLLSTAASRCLLLINKLMWQMFELRAWWASWLPSHWVWDKTKLESSVFCTLRGKCIWNASSGQGEAPWQSNGLRSDKPICCPLWIQFVMWQHKSQHLCHQICIQGHGRDCHQAPFSSYETTQQLIPSQSDFNYAQQESKSLPLLAKFAWLNNNPLYHDLLFFRQYDNLISEV